MISQQLPLGFRLRDDATFDSFLPINNEQVVQSIQALLQANNSEPYVYVWGALGSGRTHLLQACCHAAPEYKKSAFYISLDPEHNFTPEIFSGLENIDLVCLDDIDHIAGQANWEEQIFHLFNRVRDHNKKLLIAGNCSPTLLPIKLPDLKSRLSWGIVYQLHALNDEQKLTALQLRAQARGLFLEEAVGKFLLRRCGRDMAQLFATLEHLDQASLAKQRRITIPFVKEELGV